MKETTLCEIMKGRKMLLKKATRGVSKGKWNALGGKIDKGETPREGAIREVEEESGLLLKKIEKWGTITFYRGSRRRLFLKMHLFMSSNFRGRPKSTEEGRLRWFDAKKLPYDRMWDDDIYWMPLFLKGFRFDAVFVYDRRMGKVMEYTISRIRKGRLPA